MSEFLQVWHRLRQVHDCIDTALDMGNRKVFRRALREPWPWPR